MPCWGLATPRVCPGHPREGDTSVAGHSVRSWGGQRHQQPFGEEEGGT